MKATTVFYVLFLSVLLMACQGKKEQGELETSQNVPANLSSQDIEQANRALLKNEIQRIEQLIERSAWEMYRTENGLYYQVYKTNPTGAKIEVGNAVVMSGNLRLLSGKEIYKFEKNGNKRFVVGKGEVESGLETAVLNMRKGEQARIIIPSHLAYGLAGDGNKIPEKATLLYDITIENVFEKKEK